MTIKQFIKILQENDDDTRIIFKLLRRDGLSFIVDFHQVQRVNSNNTIEIQVQ